MESESENSNSKIKEAPKKKNKKIKRSKIQNSNGSYNPKGLKQRKTIKNLIKKNLLMKKKKI